MTDESSPLNHLQFISPLALLSRWPLLVLAGILGALAGLAASSLLPARYQSEAVLGVNINYGITESLELVVEDRVLGRVAAVIIADPAVDALLEKMPSDLRDRRGWQAPADLRPQLVLDRRLGDWHLVVTDADAAVAAQLAQAWAEAAIDQLDEAMVHAWRAAALMTGPFDLDCELSRIEGAPVWSCYVSEGAPDGQAIAGELQTELELSRGIPPAVSYELLQSASIPDAPVVWRHEGMVLAGAAVGMLVGLIYIFTPPVFRERIA